MKVIDHETAHWFLLEKENKLYLDANYSYSFCGYEFMIELNEAEKEKYNLEGKKYIKLLVNTIQDSCPNLKNSDSIYKKRRVEDAVSKEAYKAIMDWKEKQKIDET